LGVIDQNIPHPALRHSVEMGKRKAPSVERDEVSKRFKVLETLGEGTYGVVYKGVDLTTDRVSTHSKRS
jgi:serine/threonine protein kinase